MKKLLGIMVLGLLFCGSANSESLKPLSEYVEENQDNSDDPAFMFYITTRCASNYSFGATLFLNKGLEVESKNFQDISVKLKVVATKLLTNKSGYTNDEAVKAVLENTEDIYDRYIKDGKEHYSKTGSYINGSYIEDDLSICKKLNETIF
tara:strand:- start:167 stop:616 length:450 start_codon:yes stop_codon:yes gene_type:complete